MTGRTEWSNVGGFFGVFLGVADSLAASNQAIIQRMKTRDQNASSSKRPGSGSAEDALEAPKSLSIIGPRNLTHMVATGRTFVFRKGLPLVLTEVRDYPPLKDDAGVWQPTWRDSNVRIWAMSVAPVKADKDKSRPASAAPRKRSFDEFDRASLATGDRTESAEEREDRDHQLRQSVVSDMFGSAWTLDSLVEMPLAEVEMPAKIFVRDPETKKLEAYTGPKPGGTGVLPDIRVLVGRPWPAGMLKSLPPTTRAEEAVSYIIRNHPQRGRFRADVADALKVPSGPKRAKLTKGITVLNTDGETITPDMVIEPGKEGGGAAVIDLPSIEYVEPLVNRKEFQSNDVMDGVEAFIWLLGPGVVFCQVLQSFMRERSHLKHVVSSPDCCPNRYSMDSIAAATISLNQVDPLRYRVPVCDNVTVPQPNRNNPPTSVDSLPSFVTPAQRGMQIDLEPSVGIVGSEMPLLDLDSVVANLKPEVLRLSSGAREAVSKDISAVEEWKKSIPNADAEIITLGTGSSQPSKYRNVSGTLVRVPGYGSYLFDCGENTLGQLKRIFSPAELSQVLRDLKMIWISHRHADHHLGTVSVIKAWYAENYDCVPFQPVSAAFSNKHTANTSAASKSFKRLAIVAEDRMLDFFAEYADVEDFGFSRIAPLQIQGAAVNLGVPAELRWYSAAPSSTEPSESLIAPSEYGSLLGLSDIQSVPVRHCHGAQAVSLTFPSGFKISYSGDCRPSRSFATIGADSTVLIHEATFNDELGVDAVAKKHSTTGEALAVAAVMRAKTVVLTHFSQRFAKLPTMEDLRSGNVNRDALKVLDPDDQVAFPEPPEGEDQDPLEDLHEDDDDDEITAASLRKDGLIDGSWKPTDLKVCVAFDYMRVKVGEIPEMAKFTPAVQKVFEEVSESGENPEDQPKVEDNVQKKAKGDELSDEGAKGRKKRRERRRSSKQENEHSTVQLTRPGE